MDKMILYEDDALFVVHKPQGIATQTARIGQADVVSELKNYRKCKGEDTYIGVIHRLDQPVEGLLAFAKTPQAAAALSSQLHTGIFEKRYVAFLDGIVNEGAEAELTNYLWKDSKTNLSKVVNREISGAKKARLHYKGIKTCEEKGYSIVEITLFTGRHHQIRVQLSHAGLPLLGDMKYGTVHSKEISKGLGIESTALLAHNLVFKHPASNQKMTFSIKYEEAGFCRGSLAMQFFD